MKCPSCGLENIPGRTSCGVCGVSLVPSAAPEATLPPRARDRTARRTASLVANAPVRLRRLTMRAREHAAGLRPPGFGIKSVPLLLLAAVPGYGPLLLQGRAGAWLLTVLLAQVALALGVLFYRTILLDRVLMALVLLSIVSVTTTLQKMMASEDDELLMRWRFCVVFCLVTAFYAFCGNLVFWALPIGGSLGIQATAFARPHYTLMGSPETLHRGDLVQYDAGEGPVEAVLVGLPGETVTVFEPITVNGRPIVLHPRLTQASEGSYQPASVRVPPGHLWVFPTYYGTPTPDMLAQAGLISRRSVSGRALAVLTPPDYRRLLRPGSINLFDAEGKSH